MQRNALRTLAACALALPLALPLALRAADTTMTIERPWSRALPEVVRNGAAYLTIVNHGTAPDRLIDAASPIAEAVEIHTHLMEQGIMKMRRIDAVEIAPGEPALFRPGGDHLMLIGLHAPLLAGTRFPLTLEFEQAGAIEVTVTVHGPDATPGHPMGGKHHPTPPLQ